MTLIKHHFMYYHKVKAEHEHTHMELMLFSPQDHADALFEVYYKNGEQRSLLNYTLKLNFTCNRTVPKGELCDAFFNEHVLRKEFSYFGNVMIRTKNRNLQRRVGKSYTGKGQQESSRVHENDTNYSRSVNMKMCLYRDKNDQAIL